MLMRRKKNVTKNNKGNKKKIHKIIKLLSIQYIFKKRRLNCDTVKDSWRTSFSNVSIDVIVCIVLGIEFHALTAVYLTDFSPYVVVLTLG